MSQVLKARVVAGRYLGETVRITNVSTTAEGKKMAAVILANGTRANLKLEELEVIAEAPPEERPRRPSASMPFVSGSTGSRTMNQSRSLVAKEAMRVCERCGRSYVLEARKGRPGRLSLCEDCAIED